jgi:predicted transcriptional regulator
VVKTSNPTFLFPNSVSPRYVEPLLLQLRYDQNYVTAQFIDFLRSSGLGVKGKNIASCNMATWSLAGLGRIEKSGTQKNIFQITELGKQLIEIYSTNSELFYDLIHFLYYSAYCRSKDVRRGRFWLYANVCDQLWIEAPAQINNSVLTNQLQIECRATFPAYSPSFSDKSVGGIFPWLQMMSPPFLSKQPTKNQLYSTRRSHCTPQLFHLATEMIYTTIEGLKYGASLTINRRHIEAISRACLLDTERFWYMSDLTQMSIGGYEIRRGQWGTSIALEGPPTWITLPTFLDKKAQEDMSEFEDGEEA